MAKLIDKFWNWGHLEGSHNECTGLECSMTPEQFAEEYGIRNSFIVSYGGNIKPPFDGLAKRLSGIREIKWSVLGDASSPLPEAELGNTEDILNVLNDGTNITGGVVDDFFSPERMERFTPEVLKKIKAALNARGLDFWCVLYEFQLDLDLEKYMDCFDGITFWVWKSENIPQFDGYLKKVLDLAKGKPVMTGIYVWDWANKISRPLPAALFEEQLGKCIDNVISGATDGIVVCSSTLGDAKLKTNSILKEYINKYGDTDIS